MTAPDRSPKTVFNLVQASTVKSKRTKWLVENMIPWNGLTLLGGREGVGKSTVACAWVAAATLGNLDNKEPLNVLYLHTEDSREATIVPRLRAADADLERVFFLDIQLEYAKDDSDEKEIIDRQLTLPADFTLLRKVIEENEISLIVLDAAKSAMSSTIDGNKDESVRRMLDPMNRIADELGCVFLALVHFGKRESADTGKLITGSIAWSQVARSVIAVAKDEEGKLLVATTKHNLAPQDVTLEAHIESADVLIERETVPIGRIVWDGQSDRRLSDLLVPDNDEDNDRSELELVVLGYLEAEGGSALARDVLKYARDAGLSESTVKKARKRLGIKTRREGFGRGSKVLWSIDSPIESIDSHARERESMAPMQESMVIPLDNSTKMPGAGNLARVEETIISSLSVEVGLTKHTLAGSIPNKLDPERNLLDPALNALEAQGRIIQDLHGRYKLVKEHTNA